MMHTYLNVPLRASLLALAVAGMSACVGGGNTSSSAVNSSVPASSSEQAVSSSSTPPASSSVAVSSSSEVSSSVVTSSSSVAVSSSSVAVSSSSAPSSSGPFQTLRIQAQDYNRNNFSESTPGTREGTPSGVCAEGGPELIDLENITDMNGVCAVAWTEPGEYVEYTFSVPAGNYDIALRNASDTGSNATQQISIDGASVGSVQGAAMGWENAYGTQTLYNVAISEGEHTLRVTFANAASNLNFIEISESSGAPSSSSAASSTPSGNGAVVGDTVEAESLNTQVSKSYMIEQGAGFQNVGFFGAGSVLCYDNIDLTGVQSIEVMYARNGDHVPTDGRFAILAGGPDPLTATNLGEKFTTTTGDWTNFQPLRVGLNAHNIGQTQLCFYGTESGGIGNIDKFTLSSEAGTNDGVTEFDLGVPTGPAVDPVRVMNGQVTYGGVAKSIAGVSMFWSAPNSGSDGFYNKDVVTWLVNDWGIDLIRAAMAVDDNKPGGASLDDLGGYLTKPFVNQHALEEVVHGAIENGIYVIIDWHAHKAEDNKAEAIEFFTRMARKYGGFENVIYEVYNEPVETSWGTIKSYAQDVIAAIRAEDPDNLIIVGTRTYSQHVEEVIGSEINDPNVAYTLHFYAGTHGDTQRGWAQQAINAGVPIFVTEWGMTAADGGSDGNLASDQQINAWLDFMRNNNISHANWAISSHGQASAALVRGASTRGNWSDSDLTQGGRKVRELIKNW